MASELAQNLLEIKERYSRMRENLGLEERTARLGELEARLAQPGFWDRAEAAQETVRELKAIKELVGPWREVGKGISDLEEMLILAEEDEGMAAELAAEVAELGKKVDGLEFSLMFSEPQDAANAIFSVQAGAGGTESCDWADMLWRMYSRWAEARGYGIEVYSTSPGEEAGIKSLTASISGDHAYGYLKAERGVHRLVRISPFDSGARRHTSFASVDVIPEIDDDIEIEIADKDLRVDTYRSSGAGGQHVNKTSSAVRLTHLPTGIVVACQNERSQHKNRATAMKLLRARLYQREEDKRRAELATHHSEQRDIAWGSQIRSYVFQPYTMVKDLRTGLTVGNIQKVMDGDLDPFILEYLKSRAGKKTPAVSIAEDKP